PLTTTNLDGERISTPLQRDITIHVFGTFGAGLTLSIEGSNEVVASPTAPVVLNDSRGVGNAMTFLTAGGNAAKQLLEACTRIRPRITAGGDGTTSLTVILAAR